MPRKDSLDVDAILAAYSADPSYSRVAAELGLGPSSVRQVVKRAVANGWSPPAVEVDELAVNGDVAVATRTTFKPVKTLRELIAACEIDEKEWEVERYTCSAWTTALNVKKGQKVTAVGGRKQLAWQASAAGQQQQYLVKAFLRRRQPIATSLAALLDEIKGSRLKLPAFARLAKSSRHHRALEVSVMDPHLGLHCFKPQSDATWSLDECCEMFEVTVERLVSAAEPHGPFEEVVLAIGNDFLHSDDVFHRTTGGTIQPESVSIHEAFLRGKKLMLRYTERLRRVAPLRVYHVPGNHDRLTSFAMAQLVEAFYQGAKAKDVIVDASPSPYKFWRYGVNLIGFEHGHSVSSIRLASLMANETRTTGWADARYCEWHLGDQHRKGSSVPSTMEEQGVSVEYLPGLTAPNEWHRLKAFNWQKRGAMAFIYDREQGPLHRLQVNIDNYTGKIMGSKE